MHSEHAAPVTTLALFVTLTLGVVLAASDAHAAAPQNPRDPGSASAVNRDLPHGEPD